MAVACQGRKSETWIDCRMFLVGGPESNTSNVQLKCHYSAGYQQKSQSILIPFYNTADCRVIPIQIKISKNRF